MEENDNKGILSEETVGDKVSDFDVIQEIGLCPIGLKLKAKCKKTKKYFVLLKIDVNELNDNTKKDILREILVLRKFRHPYII